MFFFFNPYVEKIVQHIISFSPFKTTLLMKANNALIFHQLISVSEYFFILGMSYQINRIFMRIIVILYVFMFICIYFYCHSPLVAFISRHLDSCHLNYVNILIYCKFLDKQYLMQIVFSGYFFNNTTYRQWLKMNTDILTLTIFSIYH